MSSKQPRPALILTSYQVDFMGELLARYRRQLDKEMRTRWRSKKYRDIVQDETDVCNECADILNTTKGVYRLAF